MADDLCFFGFLSANVIVDCFKEFKCKPTWFTSNADNVLMAS